MTSLKCTSNKIVIDIYMYINHCPAELYAKIFHLFSAGIADTINAENEDKCFFARQKDYSQIVKSSDILKGLKLVHSSF